MKSIQSAVSFNNFKRKKSRYLLVVGVVTCECILIINIFVVEEIGALFILSLHCKVRVPYSRVRCATMTVYILLIFAHVRNTYVIDMPTSTLAVTSRSAQRTLSPL